MGQDIFDLIIILFLVSYAIRGFCKGFVVEAASLLSLIVGIWAAYNYHPRLAAHITFIHEPAWRTLAACAVTFLGAIIGISLLAKILRKIIALSFVGWADKLAGGVLGLSKGVLILGVALFILQEYFASAPFVRESRVLPYFNILNEQLRSLIPPDIISKFNL